MNVITRDLHAKDMLSSFLIRKEQIAKECFLSFEKVEKVLNCFRESLTRKDRNTTITRTESGSTGSTYVCTASANLFVATDEPVMLEFILKWQQKALCIVEKLGSQIFQAFGFSAPNVFYIPPEHAVKIVHASSKVNKKLASFAMEQPALIMLKIDGGNLKDVIKNGILKRFSTEDKKVLLEKFGEITVLDLLIGNNDRFVPFSSDPNKFFSEFPMMNSGNIMIKWKSEGDQIKLVEVYPIDNCPSLDLIEKERREEIEDLCFSILEGSSSNEMNNSENLSPKVENAKEKIAESIEGYSTVCFELIQKKELLCSRFKDNLVCEIQERGHDLHDYEDLLTLVSLHYAKGIEAGLDKLKRSSKLPKILGDYKQESSAEHAIKLIERNITHFRSVQL